MMHSLPGSHLSTMVPSVKPQHARARAPRLCVRAQSASSPGSKIEGWLKTPFDVAAFGPRATVGALISFPERLQTLQSDFQRLQELAQDPRPMEEKRDVLIKEVEDTVVEFLEKGVTIESDVLANIKTVLPSDVAKTLEDLIPPPPNKTIAPVETVDAVPEAIILYTAESVSANQTAAEMAEIKDAVAGLKASLEAIKTNTSPANTKILKLNLKEQRDRLDRRLQEMYNSASANPTIAAATREARMLLSEVDAEFFSP